MKFIKSQRGFTLVEILVVIAIIAIIFVMLLPQIDNSVARARETGVKTDFRSFQSATELILRETMGKGLTLDLLNSYLDKEQHVSNDGMKLTTNSKDPWGTPYGVEIKDGKFVFYSYGKEEDTSDIKYIFASYYHEGSVFSCTSGFVLNNIEIPVVGVNCGDDLSDSVVVMPPDSTDETISLPTEMNGPCYVIRTVGQLQAMKEDLDGCYELGNDIDASGTISWSEDIGFEPMGSYSTPFTGIFDGKNFSISGLYMKIEHSTTNEYGMFAVIEDGTIKNITFNDAKVIGGKYIGTLVGYCDYCILENVEIETTMNVTSGGGVISYANHGKYTNVKVKVDISATGDAGGFTAYEDYQSVYTQVHVNGNVISTTGDAGGFAAYIENSGLIEYSSFKGKVSGDYAGGFIGYDNQGIDINYSFVDAIIHGSSYAGGLYGQGIHSNAMDSYSLGEISGNNYVGGLFGFVMYGDQTRTYSAAKIIGGVKKGGWVGSTDGISNDVVEAFWDMEASNITTDEFAIGKTTLEMKQQSTYNGWDFANNWAINPAINDGYPYLRENPPY